MAGDVSWLMRTTYISSDASTKRAAEATRGGHVRATADQELEAELNDARTQIKAIEVRVGRGACWVEGNVGSREMLG